jgi:hypothetical protein
MQALRFLAAPTRHPNRKGEFLATHRLFLEKIAIGRFSANIDVRF